MVFVLIDSKDENITLNTVNAFDIVSHKIANSRTNTDKEYGYSCYFGYEGD